MKSTISYALALVSLVTAQANYNETTGEYLCEKPDAAYCAGDSLGTDIIIRCTGTKGQPGRCGNNLSGYPPAGVKPARCWQSSDTAGDAACEKNCIVYAPSKSWSLPSSVCTPYYTATSSADTNTEPTTTVTFVNPAPTSTSSKSSYPTTHKTDTTVTVTTCSGETGITTSTTKTPLTYTPTHNITGTPTTIKPTGQPPVTAGGAANKAAGAVALVGLVAWMV